MNEQINTVSAGRDKGGKKGVSMNRVRIGTEMQGEISPGLHSQFIEHLGGCIHDGIWVGEDSPIRNIHGMRADVVEALARLAPPVIRWPGGCYADTYHWREGIGPRDQRKVRYNGNFGTNAPDDNQFGTHEFMELCRLTGAKPWLNINLLSGTVQEMVEWMEYCNREPGYAISDERAANGDPEPFDVEYWGIGNEAWAGGGNMTPELYVQEYRKYASAAPRFGGFGPNGKKRCLVGVGPDGNKPEERVAWTKGVLAEMAKFRRPPMDAYDLHFYNWNIQHPEDKVDDFDEAGWYRVLDGALEIEDVLCEQYGLIREALAEIPSRPGPFGGPRLDLIIGEWGNWHGGFFNRDSRHPSLWQQASMRDAVTSALTLDVFHRNCDKIKLACAAQAVNVLNSAILTEGEHTILTPHFHVFEMYMPHRGAQKLPVDVMTGTAGHGDRGEVKKLYAFASEKDGVVTVNLVNASMTEAQETELNVEGAAGYLSGQVLAADSPTACNTVEDPDRVSPRPAAKPAAADGVWKTTLPAASVTVLRFRK